MKRGGVILILLIAVGIVAMGGVVRALTPCVYDSECTSIQDCLEGECLDPGYCAVDEHSDACSGCRKSSG